MIDDDDRDTRRRQSMTFPVQFNFYGHSVHPHLVMETIAYCAGFQTYLLLRRRDRDDRLSAETHLWLVVGAIFGALIGAKLLAVVESLPDYRAAAASARDGGG